MHGRMRNTHSSSTTLALSIYCTEQLQPPPLSPDVLGSSTAAGVLAALLALTEDMGMPFIVDLARSTKVSVTLVLTMAEVSLNIISPILSDLLFLHFSASACPASSDTLRSLSRSTSLPTRTIGTLSPEPLFCSICSLKLSIWSNVSSAVMLYTSTNPFPSVMYSPRSDAYSSCPAVSRMSKVQALPLTSAVLRYESSMVGSYLFGHFPAQNCRVRPDFPTPPAPTTTILSSSALILPSGPH